MTPADLRKVARPSEQLRQVADYLAEMKAPLTADQVREFADRYDALVARLERFSNPWTIEIRATSGHWHEFCHGAPLTLQQAEAREEEHKENVPTAKFRVVPWLNNEQRQHVEAQRGDRYDEAIAALKLARDCEQVSVRGKIDAVLAKAGVKP